MAAAISTQGSIRLIDALLCDRLGLAQANVVGKYCHEVFDHPRQCASCPIGPKNTPPSPPQESTPGHSRRHRLLCSPMEGQPTDTWLHLLYVDDDINQRLAVLADLERTRQAEHRLNYLVHELSNYVTAIAGHTELILAGDRINLTSRLQTIYHSADQCRSILLSSQKWTNSPRASALVSLPQIITRTLDMVQWALKDVPVTFEAAADLPRIWANPTSIEQVLINLLTNAAYAARQTSTVPKILIRIAAGDGHISIEIEDNGPGLPTDVEDRLFEPYFTTKPEGVGTGLGLMVARGLVEQMGGTLKLLSTKTGARAAMTIPTTNNGS